MKLEIETIYFDFTSEIFAYCVFYREHVYAVNSKVFLTQTRIEYKMLHWIRFIKACFLNFIVALFKIVRYERAIYSKFVAAATSVNFLQLTRTICFNLSLNFASVFVFKGASHSNYRKSRSSEPIHIK